jgi:1,4-dihydroxy-2-naphthoate octaprenyltransferase
MKTNFVLKNLRHLFFFFFLVYCIFVIIITILNMSRGLLSLVVAILVVRNNVEPKCIMHVKTRLNSVFPNMGKLSMFLLFFCTSFS